MNVSASRSGNENRLPLRPGRKPDKKEGQGSGQGNREKKRGGFCFCCAGPRAVCLFNRASGQSPGHSVALMVEARGQGHHGATEEIAGEAPKTAIGVVALAIVEVQERRRAHVGGLLDIQGLRDAA